ncbi:MAG: hypothetical protein ACREDK_09635 [Thermoplasmata archaeon]
MPDPRDLARALPTISQGWGRPSCPRGSQATVARHPPLDSLTLAALALAIVLLLTAVPASAGGAGARTPEKGGTNLPRLVPASLAGALSVEITGPPSSGEVTAGVPVTLHAQVFGGAPPYRFFWVLAPPLGGWTNRSNVTFTPMSVGAQPANVSVNDSLGDLGAATLHLWVNDPTPPVSLTISVSGVGNAIDFTAHLSGGTPPVEYAWSGPWAPSGWTNSTTWSTTQLPSGTSGISVQVRDLYNATLNASIRVVNGGTSPPWYATLVLPIVGVAVGLGIALPIAYAVRRRRAT